MENVKNTKKDKFVMVLDIIAQSESLSAPMLTEFITLEIEKLSKKTTSPKATKLQQENDKYREELMELLADGGTYTTADLIQFEQFETLTPQKISSLFKPLVDNGKVDKIQKGRSAIQYTLAK